MILSNVKTEFEIECDTNRQAHILYKSLEPEISYNPNDRSKTTMRLDDNKIIITINARDVTALRASINSYIRWIKLSVEILKI